MIKKNILAREIFYFLAITLLMSFLLEVIFPDIIQAYFNLNILLLLFILSIFYLLLTNKK